MSPHISVIIPVYNVEPYLARCLASLQAQTFSDFEVLLIDDGSTDASVGLAERFIAESHAVGDRRFRLLTKPNGGPSSARNFGIDHALGTWLAFVDGDDTVEPTFLAVLIDLAETEQADMSICNINNTYENGLVIHQFSELERFVCSGEEALRLTLEGRRITGSMCCRLLRAQTLAVSRTQTSEAQAPEAQVPDAQTLRAQVPDAQAPEALPHNVASHAVPTSEALRFPEGTTYEEAPFLAALTPRLQTVAVTTEPLYNYCLRPGSLTTESFNPRTLDAISAYEQVERLIEERYAGRADSLGNPVNPVNPLNPVNPNDPDSSSYPSLHTAARFRVLWAHFIVLDRMLATPGYRTLPDFPRVLSYLRAHTQEVLANPHFARTRKLAARVLAISVTAYRLLARAQQRRLMGGA